MWQLKIKRKPDCDSSLLEDYPTLNKTEVLSEGRTIVYDNSSTFLSFTNTKDKDIPHDATLPCYSLKSFLQLKAKS